MNLQLTRLETRLAMNADSTGELEELYTDPISGQTYELHAMPPVAGDTINSTPEPGAAASGPLYPLSSIPILSSLPGAKATIYLDFDGDYQASWGAYSQISTAAFDMDGDASTFSQAELAAIQSIWSYVSEDYSPFNVNVTTVAPPSFDNGVALRVVIGGDGAWLGQKYGGISYVGSFTNGMPNVSFAFSKNLGNGNARYTADAVSHEAGHAFGLSHQSTYSVSTLTEAYSTVSVNGASPLMGKSYSASRGTWWFGTSELGSTIYQDDMSVIASAANGFGYRAESAGTTASTATFLYNTDKRISASGVILTGSDVNCYAFLADAGPATFTVQAAAGFNNLVPTIQLYDATGTVLIASASAATNGATATFSTTLAASGSYRLVIRGDGSYGNAGQYKLSGAIAIPAASLFVAMPSAASVNAVSSSEIGVNWTSENGNESGFLLERSVNGGVWSTIANLPAGTNHYSDTAVMAGFTYGYRVVAYNSFMTASPTVAGYVSTPTPVPVVTGPPSPVVGLFVSGRSSNMVTLNWGQSSGSPTGFVISRSLNNGKTWAVIAVVSGDATSFVDRTVKPNKRFTYRIVAANNFGNSAPGNLVTVMTPKFSAVQPARKFQVVGRFARQALPFANGGFSAILSRTTSAASPVIQTAITPLDFADSVPSKVNPNKLPRVSWTAVVA